MIGGLSTSGTSRKPYNGMGKHMVVSVAESETATYGSAGRYSDKRSDEACDYGRDSGREQRLKAQPMSNSAAA